MKNVEKRCTATITKCLVIRTFVWVAGDLGSQSLLLPYTPVMGTLILRKNNVVNSPFPIQLQ